MITVLTPFPSAMLSRVLETVPNVRVVQIPGEGDLPAGITGEVLLIPPWDTGNLRVVLDRGVRWVHTIGTGVDRVPFDLLGDRPLTCARGASAIPISEWIIAMMLAFEKRLPEAWIAAPPEHWNAGFNLGRLEGKTLGLVGLGGIGAAVVRRALPFGMHVRAFKRSAASGRVPEVDIVADLTELLRTADHVVLAVPLTPATRQLINAASLAQMKRGAHLVNVSRGQLIDQDALRDALDDGRVERASLDVAEPEPLPAGHWLYSHPKVRLSPHVSWDMPGAFDLLLDTFIQNLGRYGAGKPLAGRVNIEAGY